MIGKVVHFEIGGKDAKKIQDFYSNLFSWKINTESMPEYGMVTPDGQGCIGGGICGTQPGMPPYLTFYVQVDDLQVSLDKAVSLGGKAVHPPTPIPGIGAFALFSDPDGNMVGLFKGQ